MSVSYTHLDVYKRQAETSRNNKNVSNRPRLNDSLLHGRLLCNVSNRPRLNDSLFIDFNSVDYSRDSLGNKQWIWCSTNNLEKVHSLHRKYHEKKDPFSAPGPSTLDNILR